MKTFIKLKNNHVKNLPKEFENQDVRMPESLAEIFIKEYSKAGDIIFDPFTGFGTTLVVAEKLGRDAYGIEFLKERVEYIKGNIKNKNNITHGNSLELDKYDFPMIDMSITSPPYMPKNSNEQYPFGYYMITSETYEQYLKDIKKVYSKLKNKLKPNAYVIIEIVNIINDYANTPLAFDVARVVGEVLTFEKEIIVCWEPTYGFGYDHSYCLVFKNTI